MSIHAINWSRKVCQTLSVPPHHRHLLITLACFHNDKTGQCDPSYSTLAKEMGYRERKVISLMKDLERSGLLMVWPRFIKGKQTSNEYILFGTPLSKKWQVGVHHTTPLRHVQGGTHGGVFTGAPNRGLSSMDEKAHTKKATTNGAAQ